MNHFIRLRLYSRHPYPRLASSALAIALCLLTSRLLHSSPNYKEHIAAIFEENCSDCHNAGKQSGGLDLSSFASVMKGSSGGEVVKPGLPDSSPLYMAITHAEGVKPMPDEGDKLHIDDINLIKEWIAGGLIDVPGGKSLLREMTGFSSKEGPSSIRPVDPAYPKGLPEVPSAEVIRPLPIIALAVNPWSDLIAVNGYEQVILFGRTKSNSQFQHLGNLPFPEEEIHDLRFSPDGEYLIAAGGCGGDTGYVVVFDVRTGERITRITSEGDVVLSADISADKKYIAIGTPLKKVKIYSVEDDKLIHEISKHTDWVTRVRFSPDGQWLASGDRNGSIYIWETSKGGIVFSLSEHNMKVNSLSWRSDGKLLASGGDDGKLILWDMKDGWPTRSTEAHKQKSEDRYTNRTGTLSSFIGEDGKIYSGGRDRQFKFWHADGNRSKQFELGHLPIRIASNFEGDFIAVGNEKGKVLIIDKSSGEVTQILE